MLGWLYRAIVGHFQSCDHKWATFSEMVITLRGRPETLAGTMYGLRCEKCGEVTRRYVGLL